MKLIHRPLSDADLRNLLGNDLKILKYSELANYEDLDQLLTKPTDYCIILLRRRAKLWTLDRTL
jgi:hypothetical protein